MINLFVTYRCNLACSYCFAKDLQTEFPRDLSPEDFDRFLGWMRHAGTQSMAFIGGEPTLHPDLAGMIKRTAEAGIAVVLFSNGLFSVELADRIAPHVSNFVINYNQPSLYAPVPGSAAGRDVGASAKAGGADHFFPRIFPGNTSATTTFWRDANVLA